jgi:predicted nucleotidyltransferase
MDDFISPISDTSDMLIIDGFPSIFTTEQIQFIRQSVVKAARGICGNDLHDVILYGSYAHGDYKEWSDVDIMVLVKADDTECRRIDKRLTEELSELIHRINMLLYFTVNPYDKFMQYKNDLPFYQNVLKDGIHLC